MKAKCHNLMDTSKQIIANDNRYITTTYSVFPGIEFTFVDDYALAACKALGKALA